VEKPVDIYPRYRGSDKSCPKSCDAGMSFRVDKYVSLGEHESVTKRGVGKTVRS